MEIHLLQPSNGPINSIFFLICQYKKLAPSQYRTKSSSALTATFLCSIPTPANGKIFMSLANAVTTGLAAGRFFYDLEIFNANDVNVQRLLFGEVTITQEVTR